MLVVGETRQHHPGCRPRSPILVEQGRGTHGGRSLLPPVNDGWYHQGQRIHKLHDSRNHEFMFKPHFHEASF